jgi:heat shock protein HspQ
MMTKHAKFNIGDVVLHKQHGYRAVIVDIDPLFQASGRYNPQAITRQFAHQHPWYRLLVDKTSHMTYVEEPLLQPSPHKQDRPIRNPLVSQYTKKRMH